MELKINEKDLLRILEDLVSQIPKGKVTTYKELAIALGDKIATRFIARRIKKIDGPIWRIANSDGKIKDWQVKKLKEEGIEVKNGKIDLNKYFFKDFKIKFQPLKELRKIQKEMVEKIELEDGFDKVELVGGADISFRNEEAYVIIVIIDKKFNTIEKVFHKTKVDFPYIPSFLAFREGPAVIEAYKKLKNIPDILFVNGHGIAHPVKLGLATYVGVKLDIVTIGNTKKLLVGKEEGNKIIYNREQVGWILKNKSKTYVSPGNKISLKSTYEISKRFWKEKRYTEPIYLADVLSKRFRKGEKNLLEF